MIQLKDKLKVNGGTRRYMEMIGLSLAFSLFRSELHSGQ